MARKERVQRPSRVSSYRDGQRAPTPQAGAETRAEPGAGHTPGSATTDETSRVLDDIDDLLDELDDEWTEESASEFVKGYRQQGGE